MSLTREFDTQEVLMVGCHIFIKRPIDLPERYKGIFKGKTHIERGTYVYWYPVKNTTYARLIHELERWYNIEVKYGCAGTAEI